MLVAIVLLADAPIGAQEQASQDKGLVLKAYSCPVGIIESAAERLKEKFQGQPDVRITANAPTAQILVYAPPDVQTQIAESLASIKGAGALPPNRANTVYIPPAAADARASKSISIPLQHLNGKQLEETLLRMMGNRLTQVAPAELGAKSFHLILPGGAIVRIDILAQMNSSSVSGTGSAVDSFAKLIKALDTPARTGDDNMQLVSLSHSSIPATRRAVEAMQTADMDNIPRRPVATKLFQNAKEGPSEQKSPILLAQADNQESNQDQTTEVVPAPGQLTTERGMGELGQIGPVQVEMLEGLDVLIIRGHKRDVEQVMNVIKQVEQLSAITEPTIEIYQLKYIDCQALAELIKPLYEEVYLLRQGSVSITALVKPNAVLILGRKENAKTVLDLVKRLDQPAAPDTQFHVFRLRHTSSSSAYATVTEFYTNRGGLGTRVIVSDDIRSNSLIVQASPRDMAEAAELIDRLDTPTSAAVNELRVIPLEHSMAGDLVEIIQDAIGGQTATTTTPTTPRAATAAGAGAAAGAQGGQAARPSTSSSSSEQRSTVLRFLTVDTKGQRLLQSGILKDVNISADSHSNSIVVSAPAESMDLLVALIHELDKLPAAEAQIKVFTIVNGDASNLQVMLQSLFGARTGQTGAGGVGATGQTGLQAVTLEGEGSLIPVHVAVDTRTNSIIASGSKGDLNVIEAIILRLDGSDVRNRESHVYRLRNAPAANVSTAINTFLTNVRTMQQATPGIISPFAQIEQEVIVVAETVSNSLIVSATPRYFDEIRKIIEKLDERPPMVMIQVLIAQVTLTDQEEFGVEFGLQDGLLFDRSAAITSTGTPGNSLNPGYPFNNLPLGNSPTGPSGDSTLNNAALVGSQGLSSFGLNRTNPLGFGGLVFSASSENLSVLLRALKVNGRVEVLSRPQIMTLDNQVAYVQVGQQVPQITGSSSTAVGQNNTIGQVQVGLILQVTPRISPDNIVAMQIEAQKSAVGPESEGIPVSALNGQIIRSPRIDITLAQTTVSAQDGQTVVLGGLITKNKTDFHRKVPWVGDIPILGRLFRYDGVSNERDELLIIMTPHIVRNEAQAEEIKKIEAARMNWCLSDVISLTGEVGLRPRNGDWSDKETEVIYPDLNPRAEKPSTIEEKSSAAESIPTPPAEVNPDKNAAPSGAAGTPPEPPRIPQPDTGAMVPQLRYLPSNAYLSSGGQIRSQASVASQGVQAATFEKPAGYSPQIQSGLPNSSTPYPGTSNPVAPTVYDAPPRYPTTQQQFYR